MGLVKISELIPAGTLTGTEVYPLVQAGNTKKASPDPPGTYIESLPGWNFVRDSTSPILADGSDETAKMNYWAAKGGRVILPEGTITVSDSTLIQESGTVFVGATRGGTYINCTAPNKSIFKGASDTARYTHVGFENIHVDVLDSVSGINAFDFTRLSYAWLKNCAAALRGPNSTGIYVKDAEDGGGPYYCTIEGFVYGGSQATNRGIGFGYPVGGPNPQRTANSWVIIGGRIAGPGIGIDLQGHGHTVMGVALETISDTGIRVGNSAISNSSSGNVLIGNYAENASGTPKLIEFATTAVNNLAIVGHVSGQATPAIVDNSGLNSVLNGGTNITNKLQKKLTVRGSFPSIGLEDTDASGEVNTVIAAVSKKLHFRVGATSRWEFGLGGTAGTTAAECLVNNEGIILRSANGTRYKITVGNDGALTTTVAS